MKDCPESCASDAGQGPTLLTWPSAPPQHLPGLTNILPRLTEEEMSPEAPGTVTVLPESQKLAD
jgi:hypothetical protein